MMKNADAKKDQELCNEQQEVDSQVPEKEAEPVENAEASATDDIETGKIKAELEEKSQKCEEYLNALQRAAAEFDNYRKRTVREKENLYNDVVGDTVSQFLPVLDNMERAVGSCKEGTDYAKLLEGVEMVLKQFKDTLSKMGVDEISAVGEIFNPEYHNAVMHIEDEQYGDNVIIEEFQKGYKVKEKVIRHSMVKVAN